MSINAYLNNVKDICLNHAKNELKHLVMARTAIPASEDDSNLPKIKLHRLKDASDESNTEQKSKVKKSFIQAYE